MDRYERMCSGDREAATRPVSEVWEEDAKARAETRTIVQLIEREAHVVADSYQNSGTVYHVLRAIDDNYRRWKPEQMLAAANVCVAISACNARPEIRCRAWKEKANALREMGQLHAALRALVLADDAASDTYEPAYHRAIVTYARGAVFHDMGRYEACLATFKEARAVFTVYHDRDRERSVDYFAVSILYCLGLYEEALDAYRKLLAQAIACHDDAQTWLQHGNVAHCYARLGDVTSARIHYAIAAAGYEQLGYEKDHAKMLRSLGRLEVRNRGFAGLAAMSVAREAFAALKMQGESVQTEIATIEELLAYDPNADVSSMCVEVVARAMAVGMKPAAIIHQKIDAKPRSAADGEYSSPN